MAASLCLQRGEFTRHSLAAVIEGVGGDINNAFNDTVHDSTVGWCLLYSQQRTCYKLTNVREASPGPVDRLS